MGYVCVVIGGWHCHFFAEFFQIYLVFMWTNFYSFWPKVRQTRRRPSCTLLFESLIRNLTGWIVPRGDRFGRFRNVLVSFAQPLLSAWRLHLPEQESVLWWRDVHTWNPPRLHRMFAMLRSVQQVGVLQERTLQRFARLQDLLQYK